MERSTEVPKADFVRKAESAIGHNQWTEAPVLDDPLGGIGQYHNSFKQLTSFGGRLVVAKGFWTRAGASQSPNYYCGMLAVFPDGAVDDPRRDESAILRLWFWPDEVQRISPDGSRGGLCPPEVPGDIALVVERFLLDLGYDV